MAQQVHEIIKDFELESLFRQLRQILMSEQVPEEIKRDLVKDERVQQLREKFQKKEKSL